MLSKMPFVRKFNYFYVEKYALMVVNLGTKLLSIMKKIYIKPMSEEVKIETSQMLAGPLQVMHRIATIASSVALLNVAELGETFGNN